MKRIIPFLFIVAMLCLAAQCDKNCTQCEADKAALQQQLQTCNAANTANQQKITALTLQLQTCNNDNDANKAKIVLLTNQLNECNHATEVYRAKIDELTKQLEDCADTTVLVQQLADCRAANVILQQQNTTLTQQLSDANAEKAVLTQQLADANSQKAVLIQQLADANARIAVLTQQLADCNTGKTALQQQIVTLTQQLADANSQKAVLTQQLADCNTGKAALQQQVATLTQQLNTCNATGVALQQQITTLNQQLATCNSTNTALQQQITTLTQQLNASKAENTTLKAQIVLLNKDIQAYKDSLKNCTGTGTSRIWAYSYILPNDSTVFNFWYSSEVSAPYQTRSSVGNLEFDQYYSIKGYERMYNKSSYKLAAGAAYLEVILYDSTFNKVLFTKQFPLTEMLPKTEYKFDWNTGSYTLPYVGKYYMSKVLYEKKFFKDRPLEGGYFAFSVTNSLHTALKMKTYPETASANIPNMKIYLNADTLYFPVKLDRVDSTYVVYINKAFDDIDSINFKTDADLILNSAFLSSMNLLNNPAIKVKGVTKVGNVYKILVNQPVASPLVARWRFENNGNDEKGVYPLTVSSPANMYKTPGAAEGVYYLSSDGSGYTATAPVITLGDEFSISLWYRTWNSNDGMPILGNSTVYYPNGYILYADGVTAKMFKFVTSDGTSGNRKYIMSNDGVWTPATWVHIIITASKTNPALGKMYINGVDKTRGGSTGVYLPFKTNLPLYLAKSPDSQGWCYVDDVRIYNKVLTAAEAAKLYSTGDIK